MTQNPFICTSSSGGFYGLIRIKDTDDCLCVGPCYNVAPDDKVLHDFLKEQTHPRERREDILAILSAIPTTGYTGFLNQIAFLHFCLNREHIDIGTYAHLDDTSRSSMQQRKKPAAVQRKQGAAGYPQHLRPGTGNLRSDRLRRCGKAEDFLRKSTEFPSSERGRHGR